MRISDWSSDVCSSDLPKECRKAGSQEGRPQEGGCEDHCLQARKSCAEAGRSRHQRNEDHERQRQEVERKRVVEGKSVSVRVDLGGLRTMQNKIQYHTLNLPDTTLKPTPHQQTTRHT